MWIPKVIPSYYEKKNIVENSSIIILIIIWRNYLNILLHTPDIKVFLYHITSIHICEHIFTYVSKILIFVSIILTYVINHTHIYEYWLLLQPVVQANICEYTHICASWLTFVSIIFGSFGLEYSHMCITKGFEYSHMCLLAHICEYLTLICE